MKLLEISYDGPVSFETTHNDFSYDKFKTGSLSKNKTNNTKIPKHY